MFWGFSVLLNEPIGWMTLVVIGVGLAQVLRHVSVTKCPR